MITLKKYGKMWLDDEGIQWIMVGDALEEFANLKNQMALKPNQEVIVWHKYPEEKPIDGRHLFWDSDGNAPHVLPHNDIVVRNNPGVFSTQTHWAYLPAPPKEEG